MLSYTNLHQHSKYSILDGLGEIKDIVKRCKDLGMEAVAVTDHGNTLCWYELYTECKKQGIKPIFANEMYFTPNGVSVKEKVEGWKPAYHLIVIAQNQIGLNNLMKLTSLSWLEGKYYKPRVDYAMLKKYGEGLVIAQACLGGLIAQLVMEKRLEEAEDHLLKFKKLFGDRYYLECQYTGIKEQELVNEQFKEWSLKFDIPYIITADSHYINKTDSDYHGALVAINVGGKFKTDKESDQDESGLYYTKEQYYIKSADDLAAYFSSDRDKEALARTDAIARSCNVDFKFTGDYLPKIYPTKEKERDVLYQKCLDNIMICNLDYDGGPRTAEYMERLKFEIDIVYKMGYCGYFLIVADYVEWAKKNGIITGPGRGSAAGSLISYLTGITKVDPLKYGLLFERFLSRGRAKLPKIEFDEYKISDWQAEKKSKVAKLNF